MLVFKYSFDKEMCNKNKFANVNQNMFPSPGAIRFRLLCHFWILNACS